MVVENCNASCYWLHLHRSQGLLSGFKVVFVATWKASCGKLWDYFTRYTNPQLVAKCEQILHMTSCEFDERAAKPKFVAKADPLSAIHNNKLIAHSLRAGSLVRMGYRGQRWQRQPRTSEAGEKNEARKSERARELLIFEFGPSRGSHVSDNYPVGAKPNVYKHDSPLHVETLAEDGKTSWMARWVNF